MFKVQTNHHLESILCCYMILMVQYLYPITCTQTHTKEKKEINLKKKTHISVKPIASSLYSESKIII